MRHDQGEESRHLVNIISYDEDKELFSDDEPERVQQQEVPDLSDEIAPGESEKDNLTYDKDYLSDLDTSN